jgi:hypothetical protein
MDGEWEEDFDKEKFTELIVGECMKVAEQKILIQMNGSKQKQIAFKRLNNISELNDE